MNPNNVYYHEKISAIPLENVRTMITTELKYTLLDFGKDVSMEDSMFRYMVDRVVGLLTTQYRDWEMMYFDQCMKNGMTDVYDKGQTVTVKRILTWMSAFQNSLRHILASASVQDPAPVFDLEKMAANGSRYPQIILFRMANKPTYDGDEWTLEEIEKTAAFQSWKSRRTKNLNPAKAFKIS